MHTIIKDAETRMAKCIDAFKTAITKLRTGRAHPSILDHVTVAYYGNETPLSQVANIVASDARTLTITPWEKSMVNTIDKAVRESGLGLNPVTTGDLIRVPMPALNEERRRELIKVVKQEAETARVSIRNVRRDANAEIKTLLKSKDITEDDERRMSDDVQKSTDKYVAEVDKVMEAKEKDLLEV